MHVPVPPAGGPLLSVCALTLFPEMFPGPLGHSLVGKALEAGIWSLETVDIRRFSGNKHGSVDDSPFGGGAGMVLRPDVVDRAIAAAQEGQAGRLIYLSPRGRPVTQADIRALSGSGRLVLLCGRFEGVDDRVLAARQVEEISLGDFVLSGGEIAAHAVIDACVRVLPGVLGNADTPVEESFSAGLLEYPHYTRPAVWVDADGRERSVPPVLLSGNHGAIRAWRQRQAETVTKQRRPDLWRAWCAARGDQPN